MHTLYDYLQKTMDDMTRDYGGSPYSLVLPEHLFNRLWCELSGYNFDAIHPGFHTISLNLASGPLKITKG